MARIGSVAKACAILERIARAEPDISLRDLAADLGMSKATVFHIVQTLCDEGFVEQDDDTRNYRIGLRAYYVGQAARHQRMLPRVALPYMHQLCERVSESVSLVLFRDDELIYLENVHPDRAMRLVPRVGDSLPLHCTGSGKVYLASLPDNRLADLLRRRAPLEARTDRTIVDLDVLRWEIDLVRARGYAVDDEELERGLVCIAAPVRDLSGRVVAGLSVSGNSVRMRGLGVDRVARWTQSVARRISQGLGWAGDAEVISVGEERT